MVCLDVLVLGGAQPHCEVTVAVPTMGPGVLLGPEPFWPGVLLAQLPALESLCCPCRALQFICGQLSHPFPASCYWFFSQLLQLW